jgi:hypothetical protein
VRAFKRTPIYLSSKKRMAFVRSLLFVVTTLAASRHPPPTPEIYPKNSSCPAAGSHNNQTLEWACSKIDPFVRPDHVLVPLVLPGVSLLFTHMPTLLLVSRARVRDLKAAATRAAVLWLAICAAALIYTRHSRALAYAFSLHASVYLLSHASSPTIVMGRMADLFVREVCVTVIMLCAWYMGPPLPVIDVPGFPGASCCGVTSHLAGYFLPDIAGPLAMGIVGRLMDGGEF